MAEMESDRKIFSLLEVTVSVQKTLSERYKSMFWLKAEMNKLNHYPRSGHCYPDLVEKKDGKVIAQLRATLWKDDFNRINRDFLRIVKTPLKDGIQILLCAKITFDPVHGLSLRILDIDPAFSLGELEREKQETIDQLKAQGIFESNKNLTIALVPQRIAVISVETSKGYADFVKVMDGNPWSYKFFHMLFPSVLQGDRAVDSMLYQLKRIRKVARHFDAVAIIRGGGGEVGLSCFNNIKLASEVAKFPLPVLTGIGHATNETVVEMVAFRNSITPTDLGNYLIEKHRDYALGVSQAIERLLHASRKMLLQSKHHFQWSAKSFRSLATAVLARNQHQLRLSSDDVQNCASDFLSIAMREQRHTVEQFKRAVFQFAEKQRQKVSIVVQGLGKDMALYFATRKHLVGSLENTVHHLSPQRVLSRGYSITMHNGKALKSISDVRPHDLIETILPDGTIITEVKNINDRNNE